MNAYIYYKLDSETEYDLVVAGEYFEKIGWDVQINGLSLLVTTDESERKVDGMGDDGLYFDAVLEDLKPLISLVRTSRLMRIAYLHSKQKLRLQQVMCSIAGFSDLAVE